MRWSGPCRVFGTVDSSQAVPAPFFYFSRFLKGAMLQWEAYIFDFYYGKS